MSFRPFDPEKDRKAAHRIWQEVGWLDISKEEQRAAMDDYVDGGTALVADIDGEAECLVLGPEKFKQTIHQKPDMAFEIFRELSARLRRREEDAV